MLTTQELQPRGQPCRQPCRQTCRQIEAIPSNELGEWDPDGGAGEDCMHSLAHTGEEFLQPSAALGPQNFY